MTATQMQTRQGWTTRLSALSIASALCATFATAAPAVAQTLVATGDGQVQGQVHDGTREFLGIPYAAPPIGALRFSPPASPTPWASPLDATTYPPACSQLPTLTNGDNRIENEDCLFLNVWTPETPPVTPLPVMIWIHGGSNTSGSISDFVPFPGYETLRLFDGHLITKNNNVIVVTVNYRLNVFGFFGISELAAEDANYPYAGNQGLLDQRKAMQWVQSNIAAFGGDPKNVTIFGESAGSFDVCAHVVSPMSAGLFQHAISESGGCTVGVQSPAQSTLAADTIADAVGCGAAADRLACLRAVPTAQLLDAGPLVALVGEGAGLSLSVDGGFLPEQPRETFNRGGMPMLPYMMGSNFEEGSLFFINSPELSESEYSAELLSRYGTFAPQIEAMYPASNFPTPRKALIRVMGDSTLTCSTYDVARRYSRMRNKTYAYNFTRVPPIGFISFLDLGAFHGLEISYVFGSVTPPTPADALLGAQVQGYWTSFAKSGQPRIKKGLGWPRFNQRSYRMMRLNVPLSQSKDYRRAECDFWSGLYDTGEF